MNYPIQSLAIIAPITLLVLLIVVPVIGVFAGWKRAAYWGGGTFFFFLVGSIVYRLAGGSIFNALKPLLTSLLEKTGAKVTITNELLQAVCAPVFFLGVMIIAELILLINYYVWFKRVAKIKRDVKLRKEMKAAKKAGTKAPKIEQTGWSQLQFTTKGKVINKVCGGAGLALLLAPSSITFAQAIYYTTTSPTTRANSKFSANIFNTLENVSSAFSWMGYYGKKTTGDAYNSIFSTLELSTTKAKCVDPTTGEETTGYIVMTENAAGEYVETVVSKKEGGGTPTVLDAVVDVAQTGFTNVMKKATTTVESAYPEGDQTKAVAKSIDAFSTMWNKLMDNNGTAINGVFGSTEVTSLFKGILGEVTSEEQMPTGDDYDAAFGENSTFSTMLEAYSAGTVNVQTTEHPTGEKVDFKQLKTIKVNQATFNNISESLINIVNTTDLQKDETRYADFKTKFSNIMSIMFEVAK